MRVEWEEIRATPEEENEGWRYGLSQEELLQRRLIAALRAAGISDTVEHAIRLIIRHEIESHTERWPNG